MTCETITLSIFAPRVSMFSVSTPARVSNSAISSGFFGRSTNSRSQLAENFIRTLFSLLSLSKGEGRVRVSVVGGEQDPSPQSSPRERGEAESLIAPFAKPCSCELFQKPQIVLREQTDVRDVEQNHRKPIHAETEC